MAGHDMMNSQDPECWRLCLLAICSACRSFVVLLARICRGLIMSMIMIVF